jgi:hypothetical protein
MCFIKLVNFVKGHLPLTTWLFVFTIYAGLLVQLYKN